MRSRGTANDWYLLCSECSKNVPLRISYNKDTFSSGLGYVCFLDQIHRWKVFTGNCGVVAFVIAITGGVNHPVTIPLLEVLKLQCGDMDHNARKPLPSIHLPAIRSIYLDRLTDNVDLRPGIQLEVITSVPTPKMMTALQPCTNLRELVLHIEREIFIDSHTRLHLPRLKKLGFQFRQADWQILSLILHTIDFSSPSQLDLVLLLNSGHGQSLTSVALDPPSLLLSQISDFRIEYRSTTAPSPITKASIKRILQELPVLQELHLGCVSNLCALLRSAYSSFPPNIQRLTLNGYGHIPVGLWDLLSWRDEASLPPLESLTAYDCGDASDQIVSRLKEYFQEVEMIGCDAP